MSEEQRNNLIEKIRKIIAKADSTDSQEEANAFMTKAQQLLLKHNLQMSDVEYDNTKIKGAYESVEFGNVKEEGKWETLLMSVICEFNMCHSLIHKYKNVKKGTMSVIGESHNIETTLYMYETAREVFRRLSKQAYNELRKQTLNAWPGFSELELQKSKYLPYRMPFIRSYLKGCASGLYRKMEEMREEVLNDATNSDNDSQDDQINTNQYDLMVVNNNEAIEKFIQDKFGDVKSANTNFRAGSRHAFKQGFEQGKSYNLAKQVQSGVQQDKMINNG